MFTSVITDFVQILKQSFVQSVIIHCTHSYYEIINVFPLLPMSNHYLLQHLVYNGPITSWWCSPSDQCRRHITKYIVIHFLLHPFNDLTFPSKSFMNKLNKIGDKLRPWRKSVIVLNQSLFIPFRLKHNFTELYKTVKLLNIFSFIPQLNNFS